MRYELGESVFVEANPDDIFTNDFVGTIHSFNDGKIQVVDQDGDVFDVDFEQIQSLEMSEI